MIDKYELADMCNIQVGTAYKRISRFNKGLIDCDQLFNVINSNKCARVNEKIYLINNQEWTTKRLMQAKKLTLATAQQRLYKYSHGEMSAEDVLYVGRLKTGGKNKGHYGDWGIAKTRTAAEQERNLNNIPVGSWERAQLAGG